MTFIMVPPKYSVTISKKVSSEWHRRRWHVEETNITMAMFSYFDDEATVLQIFQDSEAMVFLNILAMIGSWNYGQQSAEVRRRGWSPKHSSLKHKFHQDSI